MSKMAYLNGCFILLIKKLCDLRICKSKPQISEKVLFKNNKLL